MKFQLLDIIPYRADPITGRQVSPADRLEQTLRGRRPRRGARLRRGRRRRASRGPVPLVVAHRGARRDRGTDEPRAPQLGRDRPPGPRPGARRRGLRDDRPAVEGAPRAHDRQGQRGRAVPAVRLRDRRPVGAPRREVRGAARALGLGEASTGRVASSPGRCSTSRPFRGRTPARPRVWHGSATTLFSAALAARWGDPLFSANALQPLENYGVLVDHYRSEYARHGHEPGRDYVAAGAGALFIADTTQEAIRQYGPVYDAIVAATNVPGNNTLYRDIHHAVAEGPVLVGTAAAGHRQDPHASTPGFGPLAAVGQPSDHGAVRAAARDPRALRRRGGAGAPARAADDAVERRMRCAGVARRRWTRGRSCPRDTSFRPRGRPRGPGSEVGRARRSRASAAALWSCLGAGFATLFDATTVAYTAPSLAESMGASTAALQWFLASFSLTFGLGLVPAGRLGDAFGRRRLFVAGLTVFLIGGLLSAGGPVIGAVIAGRFVQGLGAGFVSAQVLGVIQDLYHGAARIRAFVAYTAAGAVAGLTGPLVAGIVILTVAPAEVAWRLILLVPLPLTGIAIVLALARAAAHRCEHSAGDASTSRRSPSSARSCVLLMLPVIEPGLPGDSAVASCSQHPVRSCSSRWSWWERAYVRRGQPRAVHPGARAVARLRRGQPRALLPGSGRCSRRAACSRSTSCRRRVRRRWSIAAVLIPGALGRLLVSLVSRQPLRAVRHRGAHRRRSPPRRR